MYVAGRRAGFGDPLTDLLNSASGTLESVNNAATAASTQIAQVGPVVQWVLPSIALSALAGVLLLWKISRKGGM